MTIFWDCQGVLLVDFLPYGTTINGPHYSLLRHRLRSSILEKRFGKLRHGVLLLHDNASIHKANITQIAIQYTRFVELNHSAYSPDIASKGYYLFSKLKNFLHTSNFETDDEGIMTVNHYLESLGSDFLSRGIERLRNRWIRVIDSQGEYIE